MLSRSLWRGLRPTIWYAGGRWIRYVVLRTGGLTSAIAIYDAQILLTLATVFQSPVLTGMSQAYCFSEIPHKSVGLAFVEVIIWRHGTIILVVTAPSRRQILSKAHLILSVFAVEFWFNKVWFYNRNLFCFFLRKGFYPLKKWMSFHVFLRKRFAQGIYRLFWLSKVEDASNETVFVLQEVRKSAVFSLFVFVHWDNKIPV